jgi:hypothetical protein
LDDWPMLRCRARGKSSWRAHRLVSIAERSAFAEGRYLDGIIRPADARAVDRRNPYARGTFLDRPGGQAGDLGLTPPCFPLAAVEIVAAAGERDQRRSGDRAETSELNATQHARHNARCSVNDRSMMFARAEQRNALTMMHRCPPGRWLARSVRIVCFATTSDLCSPSVSWSS